MTTVDHASVDYPKIEFKGRKLTPPSGVSLCTLEAEQSDQLRKMVDTHGRYTTRMGIVPMDDDWNPWEGL
jgi:hypothetical protein